MEGCVGGIYIWSRDGIVWFSLVSFGCELDESANTSTKVRVICGNSSGKTAK